MKKTLKALQMIILSVVIAIMFCVVPVLADEDSTSTEYTYTIRIYAGNQGSFGGGYVLKYDNLKAGDYVSFDFGSVTLNNPDKYYVMGIRESGKDNHDSSLTNSAIEVKGDADYVVAYGILGSSVAYTVNYVDTAGATVLPSATYYGNVGDEPVIAYKYVDGYFPNTYNLSRKLSANAADNVFTFVYSSTAVAPQPQPQPNQEEGGGGAGAGGAGAGGGAVAPAGGGAAAPEGGGAAAPEGGGAAPGGAEGGPEAGPEGGEVIPGEPTPGGAQPTTEENIEESTGPLAPGGETTTPAESETTTISGGGNGGNGGISGLGIAGIAAGGVVLAGGITAVIVALTRRKK